MPPTLPFTGLAPVEVFAVDDSSAQLTWRGLPAGELVAVVDGHEHVLGDAGRVGAAEVSGLAPGRVQQVGVAVGSQLVADLAVDTGPALEGPPLARIATISDLHLGQTGFGLVKPMRDGHAAGPDYPLRCALAAVREAAEWGADLLVIKGDITEMGEPDHWALLDELLDAAPMPVLAVPGNHDTFANRGSLDATSELRRRGLFPSDVQVRDLPGVRVIAADSTVARRSWGRLSHLADDLEEAAAQAQPVLLLVHHHIQTRPLPYFWPVGTPRTDGATTLDRLLAANPDLFLSSGHTHRNRARRHGTAVITEVGSTKDHPGVWAGYAVHRTGIRQIVRRVAEPDCIAWTDRTHAAVAGIWGRWSPGRLADRCLTHAWSSAGASAPTPADVAKLER